MNNKTRNAFMSFLKKLGADKAFVGLYKQYRFLDNPDDVNKYLEDIGAPFAIVYAFDFNQIKASGVLFDRQYWSKLHVKWNQTVHNECLLRQLFVDKEAYKEEAARTEGSELWFENLVNVSGCKKTQPVKTAPKDKEIRFQQDLSMVVLNETLSQKIRERGLCSMGIYADKSSDSLVLSFGNDETYKTRDYSCGKICCQHRELARYFLTYIADLSESDYHFIRYREIGANKQGDKYAILVEREYRTLRKS